MIDKYKRPRAQRLAPWCSPAINRAAGILGVRRVEEEFARPLVQHLARALLRSIYAERAIDVGTAPRDLHLKELRADWG